MQKILSLSGIVFVLLMLSIAPVFAVAPDTLVQLAEHFPAETPVLVVVNINAEMFERWDAVAQRMIAIFPEIGEEFDDAENIQESLDSAIQEIYPEGTFDTVVRPWLGDVAAMGAMSPEKNDPDVLLVVEIRDRAAATDFFSTAFEAEEVQHTLTVEADHDFFVIDDEDRPGTIAVYADRLEIWVGEVVGDGESSLNDNPQFHQSLSVMSLDQYDVTLYVDLAPFIANSSSRANQAYMEDLFNAMSGAIVLGVGLQGENTITVDMVYPTPSQEVLAANDLQYTVPAPIDPAFARFVPAGSVLYIQGYNLKDQLTASVDNLLTMISRQNPNVDSEEARLQYERMFSQLAQQFTGVTELYFEDDVLSWMTGNYGVFASLRVDAFERNMTSITALQALEIGVLVEATNPEAAQKAAANLASGLYRMLNISSGNTSDPEFALSERQIGDVTAHVVTIQSVSEEMALDVVLAASDEVFFVGTLSAAESVFLAENPLSESDKYVQALALSLDEANQLVFFNGQTIASLFERIAEIQNLDIQEEEEVAQMYNLLNNLNLITMSSAATDGVISGRFVFSLTEEAR